MKRKEFLIFLVLFVPSILIVLKLLEGYDIKGMERIIGAVVALFLLVVIGLIKKITR